VPSTFDYLAGAAHVPQRRRRADFTSAESGLATFAHNLPVSVDPSMREERRVVKPHVHGWWEFGKTSAAFADLTVDPHLSTG